MTDLPPWAITLRNAKLRPSLSLPVIEVTESIATRGFRGIVIGNRGDDASLRVRWEWPHQVRNGRCCECKRELAYGDQGTCTQMTTSPTYGTRPDMSTDAGMLYVISMILRAHPSESAWLTPRAMAVFRGDMGSQDQNEIAEMAASLLPLDHPLNLWK